MRSLRLKAEHISIAITPAVLTVLMVLLSAVPLHIPGANQLMPLLVLINIYYWQMFCPGLMPLTFLLALGLLEDTLRGVPLGVSSFVNIVFALLLMREHRAFGKARFGAVWFGFILLSLMAVSLDWVIISFFFGRMLPAGTHLLQWLATCLAYPPMHRLLSRLRRTVFAS